MNREDIIRMAREAGIPIEIDWAGRASTLVIKNGGTYLRGVDDLERFAADPETRTAMKMYAGASRNQLFVARLQQEKALAVLALLKLSAQNAGEAQQ